MFDGLFKSDDGAALRFFEQADKNNFQTEKNARPIYDQVLFVEVITPGSKESAPVFELERRYAEETGIAAPQRSQYFARYGKQIAAYRDGGDTDEMRGTPLTSWPAVDVAKAAELREARIFTVDALAALSDEKLRVLGPGGYEFRARAQAFLAAASGNAPTEALVTENHNLKLEVERLQGEVTDLSARLTAATAAQQGSAPPMQQTAPQQAPAALVDPFAAPPAPAPLV